MRYSNNRGFIIVTKGVTIADKLFCGVNFIAEYARFNGIFHEDGLPELEFYFSASPFSDGHMNARQGSFMCT